MKVLAMFVFAVALIAFILWHPAKPQTATQNTVSTISAPPPTYPKLEKIDTSKPPAGFIGPTEPPHMIGPSGPPPNY